MSWTFFCFCGPGRGPTRRVETAGVWIFPSARDDGFGRNPLPCPNFPFHCGAHRLQWRVTVSYQVFARKYRPRTFEDLLGQEHVVRTLRNAIGLNRIAQAYLFVGPRGTGKTSTARILSKALNCPDGPSATFDPDDDICVEIAEGRSIDVLEIDGASNNGVEQVRSLRETVNYAPARGRYKIYYIDEVHMLSTAAFNALLKTLEEPPPHVKFIFATTEVQKVLPTILSRCQRFDLRPIPAAVISSHLLHVAHLEGIEITEEAARTIARGADGGMRDAQSMLDQLVAFCGNRITEADVQEIFGFTTMQTLADLAGHVLGRRTSAALDLIHAQHEGGRDMQNLLAEFISFLRNLLLHHLEPNRTFADVTPEMMRLLANSREMIDREKLLEVIDHFSELQSRMKWSGNKKLHLEMGAIKAIQILEQVSLSDVIRYLQDGADGAPMPAVPPPVAVSIVSPATATPPRQPAPPSAVQDPVIEPEAAAPSKPAPITEAAPEPAPAPVVDAEAKPAPAAIPAPAAPQDGPALWAAALVAFENQHSGMAAEMAATATVLSYANGTLECAMPSSRTFEHDFLKPLLGDLESCLAKVAGTAVSLRLTLSDDVPDLAPPDIEDESADPEPDLPLADGSDEDGGAPPPAAEAETADEDFHNDPLIQRALELFEAKLLQENP